MTCPACGGPLTSLYHAPSLDSILSKVAECRVCSYPYNRWVVLQGRAVRYSDLSGDSRRMMDVA